MKNVQIGQELFVSLCRYHLLGDTEQESYITQQLQAKLDAAVRREQYGKYKTAETPEAREQARQAYLDAKGIPEDFRW